MNMIKILSKKTSLSKKMFENTFCKQAAILFKSELIKAVHYVVSVLHYVH